MTLTPTRGKTRMARLTTASLAAGCMLAVGTKAKSALTLTPAGIADGFSLSILYTDPAVQ